MRTIIHDGLDNLDFNVDDKVYDASKCLNRCIGCFSCWIKHPKRCIYNDIYSNITDSLKDSDELVLISRCRYGCYSSTLKRVLERCISYVLPHFTIKDGGIHHKPRYNKNLKLKVIVYGNITNIDKEILDDLVRANAINLYINEYEIDYKEIDNVYTN